MCDAAIRPFPDPTFELRCGVVAPADHAEHSGILRDYAYPGSLTTIRWLEGDRRSYRGEWPGKCPDCGPDVNTPAGHHGRHAA